MKIQIQALSLAFILTPDTSSTFCHLFSELPELPVENDLRNLNKDYDRLGKVYVAQYYTLFDNPSRRLSLVSLFHSEDSFLSFDGESFRGTKSILEKFEKLNLSQIERSISSVDTQPLREGGLIVNVIGKVKANNDPQRLYAQTFIFRPQKGSFFLQHDIFRTILD